MTLKPQRRPRSEAPKIPPAQLFPGSALLTRPLTHRHGRAEVGRHGDAPGRPLKVALLICECGFILVAEALRSNQRDAFVLHDDT